MLESFIVSNGVRDDLLEDSIAAPNDWDRLDAANNVQDDPLEGLADAAVGDDVWNDVLVDLAAVLVENMEESLETYFLIHIFEIKSPLDPVPHYKLLCLIFTHTHQNEF